MASPHQSRPAANPALPMLSASGLDLEVGVSPTCGSVRMMNSGMRRELTWAAKSASAASPAPPACASSASSAALLRKASTSATAP
ncbi:hypothetical protein D9M68_939340 [compost metagenome]